MSLRITGGMWRGRRVTPPRTALRPTQERVREALFSMLAARLPGARFADVCAGSGVVGLEALSRGAAAVTWVESDRRACRAIGAAVEALAGARGDVVCADAGLWIGGIVGARRYDMIFADPPYAREGVNRVAGRLLERAAGALAADGLLILEQAAREPAAGRPGWVTLDERVYGDARLTLLTPAPEEA